MRAIFPENVNGDYSSYDIVISGHSHYSHYFQKFYNADDVEMRNKKIVHFINPGSVGQPRNHNPNAQYAIIDIKDMSVSLNTVNYPRKKLWIYMMVVLMILSEKIRKRNLNYWRILLMKILYVISGVTGMTGNELVRQLLGESDEEVKLSALIIFMHLQLTL